LREKVNGMKTRTLTKLQFEAEPYRLWNAYVDLLAMESYGDLTVQQRPAHLVFWYESEVQNGGHLQYFENRGTKWSGETVAALELLGADCQGQILKEATQVFVSHNRKPITTSEEFSAIALEGEFDAFDSRFHSCSPQLDEYLKAYLEQNTQLFVTIL
jgi:hypothetical protein